MDYRFIQELPPLEIRFEDIVWPPGWIVPSNKASDDAIVAIEKAYGQMLFHSPKGEPNQLNEPAWAGLYAHENVLLWTPDEERFYSYNPSNGLWDTESIPSIRAKVCNRLLQAAQQMNVPWLARQRASAKLSGVIAHLQGITCKRKPFQKEMEYVHVANGILLWRGDQFVFEEFSPDFYSRNASPVAYRPGAACPRFMAELLNRSLRPEDAALLQKFAGLYLLGRNIIQRFLILEGEAGTGKSQVAVILRGLVGDHNCANLRTELLDERFELANYRSKSLLIGSDVGSDFLTNRGAQQLKALTGGDQLMVELKGCNDPEPLIGTFNVLLTTNCRLRIRLQEDVGAWRRRIAIINFTGQPPEIAIPDFGKVLLRDEGPGILNWAMDGLNLLYAELKSNKGRIILDTEQVDLVDRLLLESQSLKAYLQECVRWDIESDLTTAEILEAYSDWCDQKKIDPIPEFIAQKQLIHLMLELFKVSRSSSVIRNEKNQKGYHKISFVNKNEEQNESY
jgi:putative DNA primase/helicase